MRKWIVALLLSGSVVMAGGSVPESMLSHTQASVGGDYYYAGFGIGKIWVKDDASDEEIASAGLTVQVGYQYNPYIAIEGRLFYGIDTTYDPGSTGNLANSYDGHLSGWGVYLKPMLPMGRLSMYGLVGYGGLMLHDLEGGDAYEDSFQWGAGLQYQVTKDVHVFVDYLKLYDDKGFDYRATKDAVNATMWTVGLTIRF